MNKSILNSNLLVSFERFWLKRVLFRPIWKENLEGFDIVVGGLA